MCHHGLCVGRICFPIWEAQAAASHRRDVDEEANELSIAEAGGVSLDSRLVPGRQVHLVLLTGEQVGGTVVDVAPTWLLLTDRGQQIVVLMSAIVAVEGMQRGDARPARTASAPGVGYALRHLAELDRMVVVSTAAGAWRGFITAVGADYLELIPEGGADSVALGFRAIASVRG